MGTKLCYCNAEQIDVLMCTTTSLLHWSEHKQLYYRASHKYMWALGTAHPLFLWHIPNVDGAWLCRIGLLVDPGYWPVLKIKTFNETKSNSSIKVVNT